MKTRRFLTLFAFIVLAAVCQSQCGCASWFRDPPPPAVHDQHQVASWALQKEFVWGVMFGVFGIGVGVFLLVELPFKKLGWGIILGSSAIIAACLSLSWILPYVGWILLGAVVIGGAALLWAKIKLRNIARAAWDAVPESAVIDPKAELLLNKIA